MQTAPGRRFLATLATALAVVGTSGAESMAEASPGLLDDPLTSAVRSLRKRAENLGSAGYSYNYTSRQIVRPGTFPGSTDQSHYTFGDDRIVAMKKTGTITVIYDGKRLFVGNRTLAGTATLQDGSTKAVDYKYSTERSAWVEPGGRTTLLNRHYNQPEWGAEITTAPGCLDIAERTAIMTEILIATGLEKIESEPTAESRSRVELSVDKNAGKTHRVEKTSTGRFTKFRTITYDNSSGEAVAAALSATDSTSSEPARLHSGIQMSWASSNGSSYRKEVVRVDEEWPDIEKPLLKLEIAGEPRFNGEEVIPEIPEIHMGMDFTVDPPRELDTPYSRLPKAPGLPSAPGTPGKPSPAPTPLR